jgi:hypothetical protein
LKKPIDRLGRRRGSVDGGFTTRCGFESQRSFVQHIGRSPMFTTKREGVVRASVLLLPETDTDG